MSVDFDLDMELEDLTLEEPSEGTPELDFGEELELELEAVSEDDLEDLLEREENVLPEVEVSSFEIDIDDVEEYDKAVQQAIEKFERGRVRAEDNKREEINRILQMYVNESVDNRLQFKVLENLKSAIRTKFNAESDNWSKETLSRAPSAILETFKPEMGRVYTYICDKIQAGEPVAKIQESALMQLSQLLWRFNGKLPEKERIRETSQVSAYLRSYVLEAITHLQDFSTKETLMQREVEDLLQEYGRPVLDTQKLLLELIGKLNSSPAWEEIFSFVDYVQLSNKFHVGCAFCDEPTEVENLAYVYTYGARDIVNVFKPIFRCKGCGRYLLFTRQEYDAIDKKVKSLATEKRIHESALGSRFLSVYKPAPEIYRDVVPHLQMSTENESFEELTTDEFEDLLSELQPHIEGYRSRVSTYRLLKTSKIEVIPNTEFSLRKYWRSKAYRVNIRNLSKYLAVIYGEDYKELKEYAMSTILENFEKDPLMSGLSRFLDDVQRAQFQQAKELSGSYDRRYPERYLWLYNRISTITRVPFDSVVTLEGITDKKKFAEMVKQVQSLGDVSFDFVRDLDDLIPYFTFKAIELTPLNKDKWKTALQNKELRNFLDAASDLMILSHFATEFFHDYDKKSISYGQNSIKGNGQNSNLTHVIVTKDRGERIKQITRLFATIEKVMKDLRENVDVDSSSYGMSFSEKEVFSEIFLYYFDFSYDLRFFSDLLIALQMGDAEFIEECKGICGYLLGTLGVVAGVQHSCDGSLSEYRTMLPCREVLIPHHKDFVAKYYKTFLGDKFTESEILQGLPEEIMYLDLGELEDLCASGDVSFSSVLEKIAKKNVTTCAIREEDYRLYLYTYCFLVYRQDFISSDVNRSYRSLMVDLMKIFVSFGNLMFDLLDIDRNVFSSIVSQVEDFSFSDIEETQVDELQRLIGSSVSDDALAQELISRASVAGISSFLEKELPEELASSVEEEFKPVAANDLEDLLDSLEHFIYPERVKALIDTIWAEVTQEQLDMKLKQGLQEESNNEVIQEGILDLF